MSEITTVLPHRPMTPMMTAPKPLTQSCFKKLAITNYENALLRDVMSVMNSEKKSCDVAMLSRMVSSTNTFSFMGGYTFITSLRASCNTIRKSKQLHFHPEMAVMVWSGSATYPSDCTRCWCSKRPHSPKEGRARLRPIRLGPAWLFELGPFDLGQWGSSTLAKKNLIVIFSTQANPPPLHRGGQKQCSPKASDAFTHTRLMPTFLGFSRPSNQTSAAQAMFREMPAEGPKLGVLVFWVFGVFGVFEVFEVFGFWSLGVRSSGYANRIGLSQNWPKSFKFFFLATSNWPTSNWPNSNWPKSNWPNSNWPKSAIGVTRKSQD